MGLKERLERDRREDQSFSGEYNTLKKEKLTNISAESMLNRAQGILSMTRDEAELEFGIIDKERAALEKIIDAYAKFADAESLMALRSYTNLADKYDKAVGTMWKLFLYEEELRLKQSNELADGYRLGWAKHVSDQNRKIVEDALEIVMEVARKSGISLYEVLEKSGKRKADAKADLAKLKEIDEAAGPGRIEGDEDEGTEE